MNDTRQPTLAIIVPVYNGAATLARCLDALLSAPGPEREVIVVDDGSDDASSEIARSMGVKTLRYTENYGDGAARNNGAHHSTAPLIVFVDADVIVQPETLQRISTFMEENPNYSAIFGSYDANPECTGFVSQYRNLLHHFTHQCANEEAETFWTGVGAVRRSDFEDVGGFAETDLSDVWLGVKLFDRGFKIRLDPSLQGKHLKTWTFLNMVTTDIFLRARPWTELILQRGRFTRDLNTSPLNRLGVISAAGVAGCAVLSPLSPILIALAMLFLVATFLASWPVFRRFSDERGMRFAVGVLPLHFTHQLCSGIGFALGFCWHWFRISLLPDEAQEHLAQHTLMARLENVTRPEA